MSDYLLYNKFTLFLSLDKSVWEEEEEDKTEQYQEVFGH